MNSKEIMEKLCEPFPQKAIGFVPVSKVFPDGQGGFKVYVSAYIDARDVARRLDQVVGPDGWETSFELVQLPSGIGENGQVQQRMPCVKCRMRVRFGETWVSKEDVGGPSKQVDLHDQMKASFSDAMKRAAVQFGVGRYLYALGDMIAPCNEKGRINPQHYPRLPNWALPGYVPPAKQEATASSNGSHAPPVPLPVEQPLPPEVARQASVPHAPNAPPPASVSPPFTPADAYQEVYQLFARAEEERDFELVKRGWQRFNQLAQFMMPTDKEELIKMKNELKTWFDSLQASPEPMS